MGYIPKIHQPFYVDRKQRGIVRGGYMDELGGLLVGPNAQWVADALNDAVEKQRAKQSPTPDTECEP